MYAYNYSTGDDEVEYYQKYCPANTSQELDSVKHTEY